MFAIVIAAVAFTATSASAFEFHGYLRTAGFGVNTKGGGQVCFSLPGTDFKFRLGNECENYAELEFNESLYKDKNGVEFKYVGMLAYQTQDAQDYESLKGDNSFNDIALRQNWIGAKLPQLGNATIWIGKRYFHREDVHTIDFFYVQPTGPGAGIEDVDVGFGKLAFSVFQNGGLGNATYQVITPTLHWYGIPVNPGGSLEIIAAANVTTSHPQTTGAVVSPFVTVEHLQTNLFGGFNKLAFQWGEGSASPISPYPDGNAPTSHNQWRIIEMLQFQPVPEFSGMLVFVYQSKNHVYGGTDVNTWAAGVRPAYHVNDYFKLTADFGYQAITPKAGGDTASLWKLTVAPTLVAGGNFWSRPELRLFVTYASWNTAAQTAAGAGGIAGNAFGSDTNGVTAGAQLEAWW
jgi:maltoporin